MIVFEQRGDLKRTIKFLETVKRINFMAEAAKYGQRGVQALASNTPTRSGTTAASWNYEIKETSSGFGIYWTNSNINEGVNIAVILQYGHGTRNGGYVQGRDYINPAILPVFDDIANGLWELVTSA
jgi:hypothetical protein